MAQFSAGLSEVIAPAPWPTPEFLPGAAPYASETWDNGISLVAHMVSSATCLELSLSGVSMALGGTLQRTLQNLD